MTQTQEDINMLQRHEEIIHRDILPRLDRFEKAQLDFSNQVESIKSSQTGLELTVMKDGQETRNLLNKFVDHFIGVDKDKLAINERVTLKRFSSKEKITLAVIAAIAGSGGLIAAIVTLVEALK